MRFTWKTLKYTFVCLFLDKKMPGERYNFILQNYDFLK